jgi:putative membrane protein
MTESQGDLASLSRFIFRAPSWYSSIIFALLIAAATGVAAFDSNYWLEDAWQGVFYIGLPTVLASIITPSVDRWLDGQLTPNRASLLALFCELVTVVILMFAGVVALLTRLDQEFVLEALLVALASIFAFRLLVIMAVSRQSLPVASISASVQTVSAAVLLFIYSGTMRYLEFGGGPIARSFLFRPNHAPARIQQLGYFEPGKFGLLAAMCLLYAGAVWLFLVVIDRPWKQTLGVSVLDFIRGFIGHIADGTTELEDFFEELGTEAMVPVTVLSFRRPATDGGDEDETREKARFVLPMIHPGPMGEIGGGNLPVRVAEQADGVAFPPHATAGHDFNLVTEREVGTICETANEAYEKLDYSTEATPGHRLTEGEATLTGQAFGDDAFVVSTFSPGFADDVEYAVGLSAVSEARSGGFDDVMLADAHNCNNGLEGDDLGHVVPGSSRSFDLIYGAGELGTELDDAERGPLALGVAWEETPWEPRDGIGPLGIRVAVTEVAGHRTAYVLVDGNNMEPGLRDRIVEELTTHDEEYGVDLVEVMTTDTHIVNTVEAENQVGQAIDDDDLLALVEDLTERAVADLEPVEVGMASEKAEVTVFGNDRTETLASTANAVISLGGALAGAFILAVFTVSILLFFLT